MHPSQRNRVYWRCQILGWIFYAASGLTFIALFPPGPPFWRFAIVYGGAAAIAIGATHLYRRWLQPRGWTRLSPLPLLPRVAVASVVLGGIIVVLVNLLYYPVFPRQFITGSGLSWLFPALYAWIAAVFVWNVLYFGQHYFEHYREAEITALRLAVAAKESNLRALESQLNPHFVFNCLNSLRGLIGEDPARAQMLVTELASLLRYTLTAGRRGTVTLNEELEAVEAYLQLEAIRLEERLQVEWAVDPTARPCQLPAMLLQTLVENAVKHGIAAQIGGGCLRIAARQQTGHLQLEVSNPGQLRSSSASTRVGLENARERLQLVYNGAAELALANAGPDTVVARALIPITPITIAQPAPA